MLHLYLDEVPKNKEEMFILDLYSWASLSGVKSKIDSQCCLTAPAFLFNIF